MKKVFLTILISTAISVSIYSQNKTLIDFENLNPMIEIDTIDENNIWQIGQPSKQDFNSAYSGKKSIITDSINSYPVNCNSHFILKINSKFLNYQGVEVSFWHKYETDSINDYGKIEYSYDGGINWQTLKDTMYQDNGAYGHWFHCDSANKHCWNGNLQVTGSSSGWIYSLYGWTWYIPAKIDRNDGDTQGNLKSTVTSIPDSIYIRFLFLSDYKEDSKSGWMIDNIEIEEEKIIGSISDFYSEKNISIFPNPVSESITIQFSNNLSFDTYSLYSIDGKKLLEKRLFDSVIELKVSDYKKGIYFIAFYGKNNPITKKIIIR